MNENQKKIQHYMDEKIDALKRGMYNLRDRDYQPNSMGDLYNGMLKHSVEFEIKHMEHLKEELIDELE
jgi:hypothetical protein